MNSIFQSIFNLSFAVVALLLIYLLGMSYLIRFSVKKGWMRRETWTEQGSYWIPFRYIIDSPAIQLWRDYLALTLLLLGSLVLTGWLLVQAIPPGGIISIVLVYIFCVGLIYGLMVRLQRQREEARNPLNQPVVKPRKKLNASSKSR